MTAPRTTPIAVDLELVERAKAVWPYLRDEIESRERLHVRDGSIRGAVDLLLSLALGRAERAQRRRGLDTPAKPEAPADRT